MLIERCPEPAGPHHGNVTSKVGAVGAKLQAGGDYTLFFSGFVGDSGIAKHAHNFDALLVLMWAMSKVVTVLP